MVVFINRGAQCTPQNTSILPIGTLKSSKNGPRTFGSFQMEALGELKAAFPDLPERSSPNAGAKGRCAFVFEGSLGYMSYSLNFLKKVI